jgi:MYXO-CTERM domain-containing protein
MIASRWMRSGVLAACVLGAAALSSPREASACGGCVHAPSVSPLSVTQHRMALALSSRQTTLWDQFSFAGSASEFAWILPIRHDPAVRVEVADDRFLAMFDQQTAPQLALPPRPPSPCPTQCAWDPCQPVFTSDASATLDAATNADASVTVFRMTDVGPYSVAIIGGSDAMALRAWLSSNGYSVPATIEPVLDAYIAQRMDFVAVRLRSTATAMRMSPIRVTVPGYAPTLPLRMVAAGISDKVGLQLVVFADSRVEALNFANAEINDNEFAYDYATQPWPPPADALPTLIRAKHRQAAGRTWLTESATRWTPDNVRSTAQAAQRQWRSSSCGAGSPPWDLNCGGPQAINDAEVALNGLGANITVTRMTAELAYTVLDADLQLGASVSDAPRSRDYRYGTLRNIPAPPVCTPLNCPTTCDRDARTDAPTDAPTEVRTDARMDAADVARFDAGVGDASAPQLTAGGGLRCAVRPGPATRGPSAWVWLSIAAAIAARRAIVRRR